jgi:hypothetical protein
VKLRFLAISAMVLLSACTTSPLENTMTGVMGAGAVGAGIGCAVTIPIGCAPGAMIGGMIGMGVGGASGLASTKYPPTAIGQPVPPPGPPMVSPYAYP